jgi:hypothetical protein
MKGNKAVRIVKFALFAVLAVIVCGFVIMGLWNWLLPGIFGLHPITFLQALGLLILCKLLFGGFHGGRSGRDWRWRRRMMERWEKMTPEEREKFRESFRRCGPWEESSENENAAKSG